MRILQVVQGFPPEFIAGTELYCHALSRALLRKGHECLILAGSYQPTKEPALVTTEEDGLSVTRYTTPLLPEWREQQIDPYNPEAERMIRQHLALVRPNVLHVHHWLKFTPGIVTVAAQAGIPSVVTLHDLWTSCARLHRQHKHGHFCQEPPSPTLCASCVERAAWQDDEEVRQALAFRQEQIAEELRVASCLLTPSSHHRDFLSRLLHIPPDRFRVLPHGALVQLSRRDERSSSGFPERRLRIGYWGHLAPHKGAHVLLEAVRQLPEPSAVEVILMGATPDAQYLEHIHTLARGLAVSILGEYRPEELSRVDVDIAVFPSLAYESYGFVLDEAFQLGIPAIVSDRGALASRAGEAGLAFAAGDAAALARRIQEVLDTPALLEGMRRKIPASSSPSMDEHVQSLEIIYQEAQHACLQPPPALSASLSRRFAFFHSGLAARDRKLVALRGELRQKEEELQRREEELQRKATEIQQLNRAIRETSEELSRKADDAIRLDLQVREEKARAEVLATWLYKIEHSVGWRLLNRFYFLRERLVAPPGTRRGRYYDLLKRMGVTFADAGPAAALRETRQQLAEQVVKPVEPYRRWLERHALTPEKVRALREEVQQLPYQPKISIVTPVYNTEETWLRKAIVSVKNQIYPHWELCLCDDGSTASHVSRVLGEYSGQDERIRVVRSPHNRGISAASNGALSLATGEFVGLLDHDDELTADALAEVVKLLNDRPELDFIYSDEDKLTIDGRREEPFFKPDWSPDLLLSMNYIAHFSVARRSIVQEIGGFTEGLEGSQDYDLFLRISEKTQKIGHIAKPLYSWRKIPQSAAGDVQAKPYAHTAGLQALQRHLQRQRIEGEVTDGLVPPFRYRVRYRISGQPLVSIIIPIKDKVELLKRCLASIEGKTTYRRFEVIIVDNQSEEPETLAYLSRSPHKVVSSPGPFNFSYLNNVGVAHAQGEFVVFLNNDTEVIDEEWLSAMLEHAQRPRVGAVGAKLLYPDRTIQHAGVVLGVGGTANHCFLHQPEDAPGYFCLLQVVRDCSAVTAACMMMRKAVFLEAGGFDEQLRVAFNDVDLCLRLREKGYLVVYTPYAVLYHLESASRKKMHPMSDETYFRTRWREILSAGDPYYNPHLSLERFDFNLRVLDGQGAENSPLTE